MGDPVPVRLDLDPGHPTPLYHQISTGIRWKIGTGELRPGDLLPPLRRAAESWGVNYHTVRRAYREMADAGMVSLARGDGTRVLGAARSGSVPRGRAGVGASDYVEAFVAEAGRRFGLERSELIELIEGGRGEETPPTVVLVECNEHQRTDLAAQLEASLGVRALPWPLDADEAPPPGPIVGTWFHFGEMRRSWPERVEDMRFAALRIAPEVLDALRGRAPEARRMIVYEADVGTGRQHAADLLAALGVPLEVAVEARPPEEGDLDSPDTLHMIAPRLWDRLPEELKVRPEVVLLRHVFEPDDLEALGAGLVGDGSFRGRPVAAAAAP